MDQRAPQHRLRQTIGEPERFHRADMTGYGHGEVQPRRGQQGGRHSEFRMIAFGKDTVDELAAAVGEKEAGGDHPGGRARRMERRDDFDEAGAEIEPSEVGGGIGEPAEKNQPFSVFL